MQRNNKSGHTGVSRTRWNKWASRIHKNGIQFCLGNFEKYEHAVAAYEDADALIKSGQFPRHPKLRSALNGSVLEKRKIKRRLEKEADPLLAYYRGKRGNAQKTQVPFGLQPDDLVMPEYCAAHKTVGIYKRIFLNNGGTSSHDTATLDQILPWPIGPGYYKGNIEWLCYRCNLMKSNFFRSKDFWQTATAVGNYIERNELRLAA